MRVRHIGLAAVAVVAGASLLRSSIPLAVGDALLDPTLNLTLSVEAPEALGSPAFVTAIAGQPVRSFAAAERAAVRLPRSLPDGLRLMALAVKVGGGRPRPVWTDAVSVEELLGAMGVVLADADRVRPSRKETLRPGIRVRVIQIRRVLEKAPVVTPFETLIHYSTDLGTGESAVDVPGAPGVALQTFRVTYRNGKETSRLLITDEVLSQPVDRVLLVGPGPIPVPKSGTQYGQASWYDWDICQGEGLTAAHLTIPKGTQVTVTNLDNGKSVTVVINDRGPYGVPGRIIDLCDDAFVQIAPLGQGVADVVITW